MTGPEHAQAGAQWLQRALRHEGWEAKGIEEVLWEEARDASQADGAARRNEAVHPR